MWLPDPRRYGGALSDNPNPKTTMKTICGSYRGASEFASFDKSLDSLTPLEMRILLTHILHRASPGDNKHWKLMYRQLEIVEQLAREQGAKI